MRRFYIGLLGAVGASMASAQQYRVVELNDLPGGGTFSTASSINNLNQVVGTTPTTKAQAFFWQSSTGGIEIPSLPSAPGDSFAYGLNDFGVVTGRMDDQFSTVIKAFRWTLNDGTTDLGKLPSSGPSRLGEAVNNLGEIVGMSSRAFRWRPVVGMTDLGTLGSDTQSWAYGINDNGQVVGRSSGSTTMGFIWDQANGMRPLGDLPGGAYGSDAKDINNVGQVTGNSWNELGGSAFIWDELNGMRSLGALTPSNYNSRGNAINVLGQVVGESLVGNQFRAFVWDDVHGMRNMNDLIAPESAGWRIDAANDINDLGVIVGRGVNPEGRTMAYMAVPVPEPGAWLVLLFGGLFGLANRKRRLK